MLTKALCDPDIPLPTKVAHLFAISDILHNSTAPVRNASRYRSLLEAALPDVFESLQVGSVVGSLDAACLYFFSGAVWDPGPHTNSL